MENSSAAAGRESRIHVRNGLTRWLVGTALLGALVLAITSDGPVQGAPADARRAASEAVPVLLASNVAAAPVDTIAASSTSGEEAVAALGSRLTVVARAYGRTPDELADMLRSDATLRVDANDKLFYAERVLDTTTASATALAAEGTPEGAAPFPLADTFKLHSLPGAKLTILLDFDGETMSGNQWTATKNGGSDIVCPPWSMDGPANPGFSDAEKTAIQDIWRRVAEDYAPFNVDVTTEFTSEAAITRTSLSDLNYGTRVLISPIGSLFPGYGGIAYVGVFANTSDWYKPALVFPEALGPNSPKYIAEAASHECGHNLNLYHDGTVSPAREYYSGTGSGAIGWAPIMGVGYDRELTQWSKGEYPSATRTTEDDLSIIQGYLAYRPDDAGDTTATALALPASSTLSTAGIVGASTDLDVYRFSAGAGTTAITVSPAALGPNLDIYAEIRRPDGSVVAASNPDALLTASFSVALPAGTYYLTVRGTGRLTPLDDGGYSNYGSIGQYTIAGTVPYASPVTVATPTPSNAFTNWASTNVTISLAASEPIYGVASTRYSLNSAAAVTYTGTPFVISAAGTTTVAYRSQNTVGDVETTKTATVRIDKVKPTTTAPGLLGSYAAGGGKTVTLSPSDALSGVANTSWRIGTSGAYTSGVTATVPSAAGVYTLQYYSTDAAGNVEAVQSATVTVIDTTPPVTTATVSPAAATTTWVATGVTITLSASDATPGVAWTRYSIDGAAEQTYSAPIVIENSGVTTVHYRSQDGSGNAETTKTVTVMLDKLAPVTSVPDLEDGYSRNSGESITLAATDAHSGVSATYWRLGTSGAFTSGASVPVPSAVGSYSVQYYSVDAVGNSESVRTATFEVTAVPVTRVAGDDRYDTAVELARAGWDEDGSLAWEGVDHVIIANGESGREADPIGAAGLAGAYDAPVLLTQGSRLPSSTRKAITEIAKANPGVRVHLIGGTSVVPDARWTDIRKIPGVSQTKHRVYGSTRYSTSAAIARAVVAEMGEHRIQGVLIVAVDNPNAFFDALAASPIAYARAMPMIGVKKSTLEPAAMNVLENELVGKPLYFVNSDAFVTRGVKMAMGGASPTSLATSSDRYTAATQIAQAAVNRDWMTRTNSGMAAKLPDALTGGTYIGMRDGVLLFTGSSSTVAPVTKSYLTTHKTEIGHGWIIGGTAAIPATQETSFRNLLK